MEGFTALVVGFFALISEGGAQVDSRHWTPSAKILTLRLQCHFEDAVDHSDVIYTG